MMIRLSVSLTQSCNRQSSTCSFCSSFSYTFRFDFLLARDYELSRAGAALSTFLSDSVLEGHDVLTGCAS